MKEDCRSSVCPFAETTRGELPPLPAEKEPANDNGPESEPEPIPPTERAFPLFV